jgi:anti-sigma factor RsiW
MREFTAKLRFRLDHRWAPHHMSEELDGELPARRRGRMARHLGECVECGRLFAGLTLVVDALHRLPAAEDGPDVAQLAASVRIRLNQPPAP